MAKKITIEEVKRRLFEVHGDSVVLIERTYTGTSNKSKFSHKLYGEWESRVDSVIKGSNHPKFHINEKIIPLSEIKQRLYSVHGDNVTIFEDTYNGIGYKSSFLHKEYGKWDAIVLHILQGGNHPQKYFDNKIIPLSEIKRKLLEIHGDTITIIDDTYKGFSKKATFVHKIHGLWETRVQCVIEGGTHKKSKYDNIKLSIDEIKKKIYDIHGDIVSIVENTYVSTYSHATFIDRDYGSWQTKVNNVLLGSGHKKRNFGGALEKLTWIQAQDRLDKVHNGSIKIDKDTFIGVNHKTTFIHDIFGKFIAIPYNIFRGHGPNSGKSSKTKATNLKRYGVENVSQDREIALKAAKKSSFRHLAVHWKTGEELICQASWEFKVVEYLNLNKIDYLWQPKVFETPILTPKGNKSTYRPDLFLIEENKWVEIKGWMRPDALIKWNWFNSEYPNSELWDQKKLKSLGIL